MKKLKQYSANYSNTNHNFVIQNIDGTADINNKYYQSICVVKNILQRGKPTLMSTYLQKQIGSIQTSSEFKKHKVLISKDINIWERLIKGSSDSLYNPAQYFYQYQEFYYYCKNRNLSSRELKNTLALLNQLIKYFQNLGVIDKTCNFQVRRLTNKNKFNINSIIFEK